MTSSPAHIHRSKEDPLASPNLRNESASTLPSSQDLSVEHFLPALRINLQNEVTDQGSIPPEKLLEKWQEVGTKVEQFRDGRGHPMETNIIPVVHAMQALNIPTLMSCEGHLEIGSSPSPWVMIGNSGPRFQFRFTGQEKLFRELLAEVAVPVVLRMSYFSVIEFSPLTPEILEKIDSPKFRLEYEALNNLIFQTFLQSAKLAFAPAEDGTPNYTPEAFAAIERENRQKLELQILIDEFYGERADSEELRIHIEPKVGIIKITSGKHLDYMPRSAELLSRRQAVMNEFALFLKGKFFSSL